VAMAPKLVIDLLGKYPQGEIASAPADSFISALFGGPLFGGARNWGCRVRFKHGVQHGRAPWHGLLAWRLLRIAW
jgi:hypothetical protein